MKIATVKAPPIRDAGIEMTRFRLSAAGRIEHPEFTAQPLADASPDSARSGRRRIFVDGHDSLTEADIYDFEKMRPGNIINGPAVIHTPITTIVIQDSQHGFMDGYKNVVIEVT